MLFFKELSGRLFPNDETSTDIEEMINDLREYFSYEEQGELLAEYQHKLRNALEEVGNLKNQLQRKTEEADKAHLTIAHLKMEINKILTSLRKFFLSIKENQRKEPPSNIPLPDDEDSLFIRKIMTKFDKGEYS